MEIRRTFDLLANLQEKFQKDDILARRTGGQWIKFSTNDYVENSHAVARGLLALGFKAGVKCISITNNRPEWNFIDMGTALAGMVHVPVYFPNSHDEYLHIFNHSDSEVIFVGNQKIYNTVTPIIAEMNHPVKVIMIDDSEDVYCLRDLYREGDQNKAKLDEIIKHNIETIDPNTCVSLIYTSGTTGLPKGVMLSHRNLMFNSHSHAVRQIKNHTHKMLSFLPLCHIYERTMNYEYQELGISIYYAENIGTFAADLKDCQGDGFCAVPRVLEMMFAKLEAVGKSMKGIKKIIYQWAWNYGLTFDNYNKNPLYTLKHKIVDNLVYSKWRENLGGHEMLVVSGGSSIQEKIVRMFNAAKLYIFEGYGMTETSPVIAVNSPADGINVIGTVGKPTDGTDLVIAEDGEILTRGPHVMLGYYKDPEQTAAVIDKDGFLHTGDIGYMYEGKYLKITDRKKEIFKLSNGKYIAPQVIETLLKENTPMIETCIVIGENEKFASAIIVPEMSKVREFAKSKGISGNDAELLASDSIVKMLHGEVNKVNTKLADHEKIKREKFVNDVWSSDNDLLSHTLKLKRNNIKKKYAALIEEIYQAE